MLVFETEKATERKSATTAGIAMLVVACVCNVCRFMHNRKLIKLCNKSQSHPSYIT